MAIVDKKKKKKNWKTSENVFFNETIEEEARCQKAAEATAPTSSVRHFVCVYRI